MRGWTLVVVAALVACVSETHERGLMGKWQTNDATPRVRDDPPPARDEPPELPPGTRVEIPADVVAKMADFVDRRSTIFADAVEVDLSREQWMQLTSISVSRDAVRREDYEDSGRGLTMITLTRLPGVPATTDSVPTVHFGDGLRVVGVDQIVLRYSAKQSVDRPVWFHAVGAGKKALYAVESDPAKEWKGKMVDVRSEIFRAGTTYRFDWSADAKP